MAGMPPGLAAYMASKKGKGGIKAAASQRLEDVSRSVGPNLQPTKGPAAITPPWKTPMKPGATPAPKHIRGGQAKKPKHITGGPDPKGISSGPPWKNPTTGSGAAK